MKHIRFIKNDGPYSPGDIAGFSPEVAEAYIRRQTAEVAFAPRPIKVQEAPVAEVDASAPEAEPTPRPRRRR